MVSKSIIKLIRSLEQKKNRIKEQLFVAEGPKLVDELLQAQSPRYILATRQWLDTHTTISNRYNHDVLHEISDKELKQISFLQHPQQVIGVFPLLNVPQPDMNRFPTDSLCLGLDGVQDPGNLGTIIRIADWFGITDIFCSEDTADLYNPKVVQATMGSLTRVHLHYTDLEQLITSLPQGYPVYGTLLDGHNMYEAPLTPNGMIVMGNEGKGISPKIKALVSHKLLIPNYPAGRQTAESLNVAIATAITCAEFRRKY